MTTTSTNSLFSAGRKIFLGLMGLAFAKVGIEALINPQAVLAQVGIILDNPSAASSMRAVYGGMHLVFGAYCLTGLVKNSTGPLELVILYTLGFIIGRISGILVDGAPNNFVTTWLITEISAFIIASTLLMKMRSTLAVENRQDLKSPS